MVFLEADASPLGARITDDALTFTDSVRFTQKDIREVQLAKAAVRAGIDILLREAGMEPKRLRFVQNRPDTAPSLFLIEGCRGGKPGVDIQPPLLLQTDTGAPTGELNVIYFRDQEV